MISIQVTTTIATLAVAVMAKEIPCLPIGELYEDGEELCTKYWTFDDAPSFVMVDDDKGLTMEFTNNVNPNDAVTSSLGFNLTGDEQCLDYHHSDFSAPANLDDSQCYYYRHNACCNNDTVSPQKVKSLYEGWDFEFCGELSASCMNYFIKETCLYECDPNMAFFRRFYDDDLVAGSNISLDGRIKYIAKCDPSTTEYENAVDASKTFNPSSEVECSNSEHNKWQVYEVPIRRSYCDAFYQACKYDLACAAGDGVQDICAAEIVAASDVEVVEKLSVEGIAAIGISGGLAVLSVFVITVLVCKERRGNPIFTKLATDDDIEM